MATSSGFADTAERSVTCPICFEFFVDPHTPKDLECPHTCCLVCLRNMVTLNPRQPITCPMRCKQKTRVPHGGVENLRTNLHVKNLAEEHPGYAKGGKPVVPKCAKHDEKMHVYCNFCNKLACQICVMVYHKGSEHMISDVGDVSEEQKRELNKIMTDSKRELDSCQKSVADLKKVENNIVTEIDAEMRKVDISRDAFIDEIKKEAEKMKRELKKSGAESLNEMRTEITRVENDASALRTAREVAVQTSTSSDYAYVIQHTGLVQKMKAINIKKPNTRSFDSKSTTAKFTRLQTVATFGKVVTNKAKARGRITTTKLKQEFGHFPQGFGTSDIASSDDGPLAVCNCNDNEVSVYTMQDEKYEKMLSLELTRGHDPVSVVICPDQKVWVSRYDGIEVYSSAGEYEETITGTGSGACRLAITENGSRILAGNTAAKYITVHDSTGSIIRTLETSIEPWRIAAIQDTHIAVNDFEKLIVMKMETGEETLNVSVDCIRAVCYDKYTDCVPVGRRPGSAGTGCNRAVLLEDWEEDSMHSGEVIQSQSIDYDTRWFTSCS